MENNQGSDNENSFAKQFHDRENIKTPGGTAEVVDIKPENPKTEIPVFFAPAWGCTLEVYQPALDELSKTNRRKISLNHPRIGGSMKDVVPDEIRQQYPTETLRKSLNILEIL